MSQNWQSHSLLLFFTIVWGGNFVLAEIALHEISPLAFSSLRLGIGGFFVVLIFLCKSQKPWRTFRAFSTNEWLRFAIVISLGAVIAPWMGIEGLKQTDGGRASIWLALGPLFSMIIGNRLKTERYGILVFTGLLLALVGFFLMIWDGLTFHTEYWRGDLLLISALLATVLELHAIKPLIIQYGAIKVLLLSSLFGSLFYLLIAYPSISEVNWNMLSTVTWIAIIFGGIVGISLGQWVKMNAIDSIGPTRVVMYGNLVPVTTLIISMFILAGNPTPTEWCAVVLMMSGIFMVQWWDYNNKALLSKSG
jgi:drug/metabolite transporter (DMT)-like permease